MDSPTLLLMMHILRYMPTSRPHSLVCSAGSLGYHALKEMLLSGVPGNTLLIESGDLREVVVAPSDDDVSLLGICRLYTTNDANVSYEYHDAVGDHTHVAVYSNRASLPAGLLFTCSELTSIDLSALTSATTAVNHYFLAGCSGLTTIDLSSLSHLTELQWGFLYDCTGLTSIDLGPLTQITTIPSSFLVGCESLESIDLSPLSGATEIGDSFLEGCFSLKTIDLSPLSWMVVVPYAFLDVCCSLTSIDMSSLIHVTSIETQFNNSGLEVLDLSALSLLKEAPKIFGNVQLILPAHLLL